MQVSIIKLLALVGLIALCIAGFVNGPPVVWAGTTVLSVLLIASVINAVVGSNETRSFAIGLLIPACAYLAITLFASENEYAATGGSLPTTRIAQSMMESKYSGRTMKIGEFSDRLRDVSDTLPLVHLSIALVLGYTGGFYALWVVRRPSANEGS